jgi:hypothetical protein
MDKQQRMILREQKNASLSLGGIARGIGGIAKGLIPGGIDDFIIDKLLPGQTTPTFGGCPAGFRQRGNECVPAIAIPGLGPGPAIPAPPSADPYGDAVMGAFGVPALAPAQLTTVRRRCPKGAVLGRDNLCYMKGTIPPKYRKWRPQPKPVVSRADQRAIRRANATRKRLVKLTKDAGAFAAMNKPRRAPSRRQIPASARIVNIDND